jgi:histidine ammonia-lyase
MNSATDNPLVFREGEGYAIVSGGHFHGQYIAQAMDLLALAVTDLAAICDRRSARLVDPACSFDLPASLIARRAGVNTGLAGVQSMGTALVMENMGLCHPASVTSLPAKGNTEDHVSNSCFAARRSRTVVQNAQAVVAVEMLLAAQALDLAERDLADWPVGAGTRAAWHAIRAHVPASLDDDRWVCDDVENVRALVVAGTVTQAVEAAIGPLWSQGASADAGSRIADLERPDPNPAQ